MEPGHEDREYVDRHLVPHLTPPPQWSPAMKTGNTITWTQPSPHGGAASMEPGHEDREYWSRTAAYWP